jgi:nucleoside-diphosphate-sugar epimerase
VLALLQANRPVTACRQKSSDLDRVKHLFSYYTENYEALFDKIKWVEMDICDLFSVEDALNGVDTVYHCAGLVSFNRHQFKRLMEVNHTGTRILVDACLQRNIQAFCHVSSIATINNQDYTAALDETVFWKRSGDESSYALSKYMGEREVWRAVEEGLNAVIVNPGLVLSPGFWNQSSSELFERCYKGIRFYTTGSTGYISAQDVAASMIRLVDGKHFGERYVLLENNYSFQTILNLIQDNFKKKRPSIRANRILLNIGWVLDSVWSFLRGKKQTLTRALVNSSFGKQLYSNRKVKEALGTTFTPVDKVIAKICSVYLSEKQNALYK